ncbi:S-4TM family putative pore-forming effector [Fructilactobacillus ixorae]|uniref:S-4TM family putative pore-forming effector n=2 Tax=Fructilactobacillus ixorae TaxID=1750535 RepID=A0ABY5C593_9LACO|nr:S-4TM family putative pore-forming effector [Fructilactobacillus ixorae]
MINLLLLQRKKYSFAKKISTIPFLLSVILIFIKSYSYYTTIFSIVFSIISFIIIRISKNKVKNAATIQELFDTSLYKLPWNNILVGEKPQVDYLENYKESKKKTLKNWYKIPEEYKNKNEIILNCQCQNLKWDKNLNLLLFISIILFFIVIWIISIWRNYSLVSILIVFFPALTQVISHIFNILDIYTSENTLIKRINKLKEKEYSKTDLRQIQDYLFIIRCNTTMTPDLIYKIYYFLFMLIMQKIICIKY